MNKFKEFFNNKVRMSQEQGKLVKIIFIGAGNKLPKMSVSYDRSNYNSAHQKNLFGEGPFDFKNNLSMSRTI